MDAERARGLDVILARLDAEFRHAEFRHAEFRHAESQHAGCRVR